MYQVAHSQMSSTKMVGMYRLSFILNLMKQCVHSAVGDEIRPGQYMKYQAFYHVLVKELNTLESWQHNFQSRTQTRRETAKKIGISLHKLLDCLR